MTLMSPTPPLPQPRGDQLKRQFKIRAPLVTAYTYTLKPHGFYSSSINRKNFTSSIFHSLPKMEAKSATR